MVENVMPDIPAVVLPVVGKLTQKFEDLKSVIDRIGITGFESAV